MHSERHRPMMKRDGDDSMVLSLVASLLDTSTLLAARKVMKGQNSAILVNYTTYHNIT